MSANTADVEAFVEYLVHSMRFAAQVVYLPQAAGNLTLRHLKAGQEFQDGSDPETVYRIAPQCSTHIGLAA